MWYEQSNGCMQYMRSCNADSTAPRHAKDNGENKAWRWVDLTWLLLPAVVVPSFLNTVLRLDRLAAVVPGRMPSSCVMVTCRQKHAHRAISTL
jgi:hypothetical protein